MLKRLECANARCGKPLPPRKRGRRQLYCSDACRKAASRETTQEQAAGDREMVAFLRGFIGQLWPVYAWDDSPRIMALIVPRNIALDELRSGFDSGVSEADLKRALSTCDVYDYEACDKPLHAAIKEFYSTRKNRRIREGYTPLDESPNAH